MANQAQLEQQEFIQAFAEDLQIKDQKQLQQAFQLLGDEGIKALYTVWKQNKKQKGAIKAALQQMAQQQQATMARNGARLNYLSQLNGKCPEGYEVERFMKGGCVKCRKKQEALMNVKPRFDKKGGKACAGTKLKFEKGKAIQHVPGGPADINSTDDMKPNKKQSKMLPKHQVGGYTRVWY